MRVPWAGAAGAGAPTKVSGGTASGALSAVEGADRDEPAGRRACRRETCGDFCSWVLLALVAALSISAEALAVADGPSAVSGCRGDRSRGPGFTPEAGLVSRGRAPAAGPVTGTPTAGPEMAAGAVIGGAAPLPGADPGASCPLGCPLDCPFACPRSGPCSCPRDWARPCPNGPGAFRERSPLSARMPTRMVAPAAVPISKERDIPAIRG